ncbi:MAG TPA: nitrite reductase small subunit NirD [Parvibaculum sp.]
MQGWTEIGDIDDIPRRGARCVMTPLGRIGVFRTQDDRVFAVEDRCPHKAGPLAQGIVHGASVTCPLHNWVISLETGEAQGADEGKVRTFPIKREGTRIFMDASAMSIVGEEERA